MDIKNILKKIFLYKKEKNYDFTLLNTNNQEAEPNTNTQSNTIFPTLSVNLDYIKSKYNFLINSDINLREFNLTIKNKNYNAALLYIDGMIDSTSINDFILKPLMLRKDSQTSETHNKYVKNAVSNNISVKRVRKFDVASYIYNSLIPQNNVKKITTFEDIISMVNNGFCALFIDTINIVFCIETKGFKVRSIAKPENEVVIRGAQEAFVENIRTNTSMLRRIINNENLIIEECEVGSISKTKIAICYLGNICNENLISEVRYRINNLNIDYLISSRAT